MATLGRIGQVPGHERVDTRLGDVAERIDRVPVGRPEQARATPLSEMDAAGGSPAMVLDSADKLAGIVHP